MFQFNQNFCQTIGIISSKSTENRWTIKSIQLIFVTFMILFEIALFGFLVNGAESMGEYGITCFMLNCTMMAFALYLIIISKMENILAFIINCEAFIEKSMWNVVPTKTFYFLYSNITFIGLQQEIKQLLIRRWLWKLI